MKALKKYSVDLIRFSLTAKLKQNNGNVYSSPKTIVDPGSFERVLP